MRVEADGLTLNSCFLRPRSWGTVTLQSANPRDQPVIDLNAFAEPYDLERAIYGIVISREMTAHMMTSSPQACQAKPREKVGKLLLVRKRLGRCPVRYVELGVLQADAFGPDFRTL